VVDLAAGPGGDDRIGRGSLGSPGIEASGCDYHEGERKEKHSIAKDKPPLVPSVVNHIIF
jgi:hypothetical protein